MTKHIVLKYYMIIKNNNISAILSPRTIHQSLMRSYIILVVTIVNDFV